MTRENSKDKKLSPLNPEQVYQLLAQKKWSDLVKLLHDYYKVIPSDYALDAAFKMFESELIRNFDEFQQDENFEKNLSNLYLIHAVKFYCFSDATANKLIVELAKNCDKKGDLPQAYYYASKFPQDSFCANVIEKYSQALPKVVAHSQSQKIRVTENKNVSATNYTISLFKSPQEHDFFMAARIVFQMYIVYPNVALSTLIDFKKIETKLSPDERKYFLTGVVDCVVFDQHNNYTPVHFFELDSSLHDSEEQIKKDRMKDNILAIAGKTLYRIRKESHGQGITEFMKLINEVVPH